MAPYDLHSLSLPKLTGAGLRTFTAARDSPITRPLLMPSLLMRYVFPANLAGLPAISFPVGYDAIGLPVGMQAMGRHWEEATLLRIACVAEQHIQRQRAGTHFSLLA